MTKKKYKRIPQKRRAVAQQLLQQPRLLYSRTEAAAILGCSYASLIRLEARGVLQAIKPLGLELGKTFYRVDDIKRLAGQVEEVVA